MSQNAKDWIKLIALIFSSGSGVTVASYLGGAKLWIAILCGLGTAGTNVWHAFSESPKSKGNNTQFLPNPNRPPAPPAQPPTRSP